MPRFEPGSVVRVPFPYTDRDTRQHRPALVVSSGGIGDGGRLLWVAMITSAANRSWPDDISLESDFQSCGLPAPSLVRTAKIATIDIDSADLLGTLDPARLGQVRAALARHLGWKDVTNTM